MSPANAIAAKVLAVLVFVSIVASLSGCGAGGGETPVVAAPAVSALPSVPDTPPPAVSDTSPANADTGVGLTTAVSVTFSEGMTRTTLNSGSFTLRPSGGGSAVNG